MRALRPIPGPTRIPPAALIATIAFVGCGGGSSGGGGGGGGSSRPSQSEYAAKANVVCEKLAGEIRAIGSSKSDLVHKAREVIPARERAISELRAIQPYAGDKLTPLWLRTRAKAIHDQQESAKHGPLSPLSVAANRALFLEFRRAQEIARAIGASKCVGVAGA